MTKTRYVVIRPSADLPDGFLPTGVDGRWYDRESFYRIHDPLDLPAAGRAVAVSTGRYETREDGAVAEVFEVRL